MHFGVGISDLESKAYKYASFSNFCLLWKSFFALIRSTYCSFMTKTELINPVFISFRVEILPKLFFWRIFLIVSFEIVKLSFIYPTLCTLMVTSVHLERDRGIEPPSHP